MWYSPKVPHSGKLRPLVSEKVEYFQITTAYQNQQLELVARHEDKPVDFLALRQPREKSHPLQISAKAGFISETPFRGKLLLIHRNTWRVHSSSALEVKLTGKLKMSRKLKYLSLSGFSWWLEIFVQATRNTWECLSPPWEERFTKPLITLNLRKL